MRPRLIIVRKPPGAHAQNLGREKLRRYRLADCDSGLNRLPDKKGHKRGQENPRNGKKQMAASAKSTD
jgi:hypothetical protein